MNATKAQTQKALESVDALVKAGIRFIPMPVFDDVDQQIKADEAIRRLREIEIRMQKADS